MTALPRIVLTMRTADRSTGDTKRNMPPGRRNYLHQTVRALQASGVSLSDIHVFPTDPDVRWIARELGGLTVPIYPPRTRRTPNRNALAQVQILDTVAADWILMLEDDLACCADLIGSVQRWIAVHASPDVHVYRLFSFRDPLETTAETYRYPLREMVGSQAVLLRAADAKDLVNWHEAHLLNWRPDKAPFQKERDRGFDKLVGYWALARWPQQPAALVTRPFFVSHVGEQSSLRINAWGLQNNRLCASSTWSYRPVSDRAGAVCS